MPEFDLLPRGVLKGHVELLLMDRATQEESRELLQEVLRYIKELPAADAVQAVHTVWHGGNWCGHCGSYKAESSRGRCANTFCHACGAKMDGGADHAIQP